MAHRAVFFDLGGTLFSYGELASRTDGLLLRHAREQGAGHSLDELRGHYYRAMQSVMARRTSERFYLHKDLFAEAHAAYLASVGLPEEPAGATLLAVGRDGSEGSVPPRPEARDTVTALRARGLHISVVSNVDDDQLEAIWAPMGLAHLFDAVTTSEEARSCKPDPAIFHLALAKAGDPAPEDVVFVGDSLTHDVAGANALGMTSVLIGRPPEDDAPAQPDHVIEELSELLAIVAA